MKKHIVFFLLFVLCVNNSIAQTIYGKIVDATTGEALEYVNIGVVGEPRGTVTNKTGDFVLEISGLPVDMTVRISMIGYASQMFTIKELSVNYGNIIQLESAAVMLSEVVVRPEKQLKLRKVGVLSCSAGAICGWGGVDHGKGNEIGIKIETGDSPVNIKSLHIRLYKQSYDTCFLRLHVRNIINALPGNELLNQQIIFPITKESGWTMIDLSDYCLVLQGDIVLSLEWVAVSGINKNRLVSVKSNGKKLPPNSVILFRAMKNRGVTYSRRGSEAQWGSTKGESASFYLTVI